MKSRHIILSVLACMLIGCESGFVVSNNCREGDTKEEDGINYKCVAGDISNIKEEDNIQVSDSFTYWKPAENCLNGVDDNDACICLDECVNGCDATGACKCSLTCTNGCDATGETCCQDNCQNGCSLSGVCLCPKGCANGCDISGNTCCDNKCQNGCDHDGACLCPGSCKYGCNDNGTCTPNPIGCTHGHDQNTGYCLCPDNCINGCDPKGETCNCPISCPNSCDATGATCLCQPSCAELSTCAPETGRCSCVETCPNGCKEDGTCDEACKTIQCQGENEQCQNGACVDLCKSVTCPDAHYCSLGRCLTIDANYNHMLDKYETAPKQGEPCRKYTDCDSEPGKGDGFCDSFIGYKCATKCTSDEQCTDVNGNGYHYVCRQDGRCAPDTFVTVLNFTEDVLITSIHSLTLATRLATKCDFTIEWGDGQTNTFSCSKSAKDCTNLTHIYAKAGTYTIEIKGTWDGFVWNDRDVISMTSPSALTEVKAFGPVRLGKNAFAFCTNLTKLSCVDIPDSSKLTTLESAFYNDEKMNDSLEQWDISHVTNLNNTFEKCTKFNQPLNNWDTSNVTTMAGMFAGATVFNQDIGNWDTSKVTTMKDMFSSATAFNQDIGNWDTSNVNDLAKTFHYATNFNQDIGKWNTSNVNRMESTFRYATAFNQDIGSWDTSKTMNMFQMFNFATAFNQDLSGWDVEKAVITDIFTASGISEENYCKAYKKWNKGSLGKEYTCE